MLARMSSILKFAAITTFAVDDCDAFRRAERAHRRTLAGMAWLLDTGGHVDTRRRKVRERGGLRRPHVDAIGSGCADGRRREDHRSRARGYGRPAARHHQGRLHRMAEREVVAVGTPRVHQVRVQLQRRTCDARERGVRHGGFRRLDRRPGNARREEQRRPRGALSRGRRAGRASGRNHAEAPGAHDGAHGRDARGDRIAVAR